MIKWIEVDETPREMGLASGNRLYRGQPQFYSTLTPTIFRKNSKGDPLYNSSEEYKLIQRLVMQEPLEFMNDSILFEKMVRAQHYGAPTRLLDVTTNPLVALYFACEKSADKDGVLYRFYPNEKVLQDYDSERVSIHTNLARLSFPQREAFLPADIPNNDKNDRALSSVEELGKFVSLDMKMEIDIKECLMSYSGKRDRFHLDLLRYPLAVWPRKTNQRLRAQQGAFLLWGTQEDLSLSETYYYSARSEQPDKNQHPKLQHKIFIISAHAKKDILKQLEKIGISKATLFPELEKSAETLGDEIKIQRD